MYHEFIGFPCNLGPWSSDPGWVTKSIVLKWSTLFFKRNTTVLNPFSRWPWVTDPDLGSCIFCLLHVITRSIGEMIYETSFTKLHSKKKQCNFPTFLRGEFSLFYRYSNFSVLQEKCEQFWNRFFCTLLPRALAKWNTLQSSSIYTLPKKKRNFPCCVSFQGECIIVWLHTGVLCFWKYYCVIVTESLVLNLRIGISLECRENVTGMVHGQSIYSHLDYFLFSGTFWS